MADLVIKAGYATVTEEDGLRFVGFVDPRKEDYALFRQSLDGGPVWFEVNDEDFGADDAVARAAIGPEGLVIDITPARAARFGYANRVAVRLKSCEGADAALAALRLMGVPGL